ncbi:MAG TPA: DUF929 family protein [Acidimicrobiales bacterium]|jgi:hypothetical protein|nr:DUF929 family protein [Acidimicrobiales bacterium]
MSSTDFEPAPTSAPEDLPAAGSRLRQVPRRYLALGLIVVAIFLLGALVLVRDHYAPTSSPTTETFNPASPSLVTTLATVPEAVYDAVGVSSPANPITPLRPTTGTGTAPMWMATVNGGPQEPVVFFYGAEFAPYAAAERWPLVLALSRFGTFRQLGLMQSSATTAFANVSTFTFYDSYYTSRYVILEQVERYSSLNPTGARYLSLQQPDTPNQRAAVSGYAATATTFPLLDVGNRWVLNASSFTPGVLLGLTQDQIAGDLSSPLSPLTQAVISATNEITATICTLDGQKPAGVCESRGVLAADQLLKITPPA